MVATNERPSASANPNGSGAATTGTWAVKEIFNPDTNIVDLSGLVFTDDKLARIGEYVELPALRGAIFDRFGMAVAEAVTKVVVDRGELTLHVQPARVSER